MTPRDVLAALLVATIWGLNLVVGKAALAQLPPIFFITLRFALVAIVMAPFVRPPPRHQLLPVIGLSVTMGLFHFSLMFTGLEGANASVAAVAINLQVPFGILLAALVFKERLGWRRAGGMALAFGGIALIAGEPRLAGQLQPLLLIIAATFAWAVGMVQVKLIKGLDPLRLNVWMAVFAAPQMLLATFLVEDGQWQAVTDADWFAYGAVFYNGILAFIVGYGLWYRLLHRYGVNQTLPFTLLVPVVGVAAAIVFLGESLTLATIAGAITTIAGVALIQLRPGQPRLEKSR